MKYIPATKINPCDRPVGIKDRISHALLEVIVKYIVTLNWNKNLERD